MRRMDKKIAWMLIEFDFRGGLLFTLDLSWGSFTHMINIDFWGIAYRYLFFHSM